eukprot:Amastigsp_a679409_8.p3 type:complete len:149 gc:universal Amastigsp_a679409_8:787-341(-)
MSRFCCSADLIEARRAWSSSSFVARAVFCDDARALSSALILLIMSAISPSDVSSSFCLSTRSRESFERSSSRASRRRSHSRLSDSTPAAPRGAVIWSLEFESAVSERWRLERSAARVATRSSSSRARRFFSSVSDSTAARSATTSARR